MAKISVGPKLWVSSSKPESLQSNDAFRTTMLSHMVTKLESLKDGEKGEVIISKLTKSSSVFTPSQKSQESISTPDMWQAQTIWPMSLREAYTHPAPFYSPTLRSQLNSMSFSLILMPQLARWNIQDHTHSHSQRLTQVLQIIKDTSNPTIAPTLNQITMISSTNGDPLPTIFRPECSSGKHLMRWKPPVSLSDRANLVQARGLPVDLNQCIEAVMANSWASSTWETYGTGLLAIFEFMEAAAIPVAKQVPVTPIVLKAFVATMAGEYSVSTIKNYINGVRAWHIIHGLPWQGETLNSKPCERPLMP